MPLDCPLVLIQLILMQINRWFVYAKPGAKIEVFQIPQATIFVLNVCYYNSYIKLKSHWEQTPDNFRNEETWIIQKTASFLFFHNSEERVAFVTISICNPTHARVDTYNFQFDVKIIILRNLLRFLINRENLLLSQYS